MVVFSKISATPIPKSRQRVNLGSSPCRITRPVCKPSSMSSGGICAMMSGPALSRSTRYRGIASECSASFGCLARGTSTALTQPFSTIHQFHIVLTPRQIGIATNHYEAVAKCASLWPRRLPDAPPCFKCKCWIPFFVTITSLTPTAMIGQYLFG